MQKRGLKGLGRLTGFRISGSAVPSEVVAGLIADRVSKVVIVCLSLFAWSAITYATGHVTTYDGLLATRSLLVRDARRDAWVVTVATGERVRRVALPALLAAAYVMPAVFIASNEAKQADFGLDMVWVLPLLGLALIWGMRGKATPR